jgi:hypothetical protein
MSSEAAIQQEIRLALGMREDIMMFRINVGKFRPIDGGPRVIQSAPEGTPDLLGVMAVRACIINEKVRAAAPIDGSTGDIIMPKIFGRAFAIEVKTEKGQQRLAQKAWQNAWEKRGGIYILARSVADVYKGLDIQP